MSIGTPPHYDSFVFQRRGGVARLSAHSTYERHLRDRRRRAAEKQKKWRGVFGDYRIGVGRAVARSPSLRTGLADFLHPALQSVVSR